MVKIAYHKLISKNTKNFFIKFIKPAILITSFMTFLYLVINTVNSNALVAKKLGDNQLGGKNEQLNNLNILDDTVLNYEIDKFNDKFLKTIVKDLELAPSLYNENDGAVCEENSGDYQHIITALPSEHLIDSIWEYISLWSLSSELKKLKQNSNIYLTDKTINGLSTIFDIDCLAFSSLSAVPRKCFNLQLVKIIKSTETLNLKDYVEEVPFILEKQSRRLFDIVKTNLKPLRQELQLQIDISEAVDSFLNDITDSVSIKKSNQESYKYICSYIEEKQHNYLPYLKSSIIFHNQEGTSNIFIFMVPANDQQFYSDEFGTSKIETIKVLAHNASESFNVALLIQCHRTIILNYFTLGTALLNAGVATIPKDEPQFVLVKAKIYNWYALSNGDV